MSEFLIRPHHMLCLQFFEGKGYSDGFVENMTRVKNRLEKDNPVVDIVRTTDDICGNCPKNTGGRCENEESVQGHDTRVYEQVRDAVGNRATWEQITKAVHTQIIEAGKMKQVCGECQWAEICFRET